MAWAQTCKIEFAAARGRRAFFLHRVVSVSIEQSVESLTDTARIELPRALYFGLGLKEQIRTGDPVRILLGYNAQNVEEFTGYVTRTSSADKVELICEDEMWKLKQQPCHGLWPKTTLPEFLKAVLPAEYSFEAAHWDLGDVRASRTNVAAVLADFQQQYNILSFFDGKKLVSGMQYSYRDTMHRVELGSLQLPVALEYFSAGEVRAKVKAQSLQAGGKKIEVEVGDADGVESKLLYSNISSTAKLKEHAEADLQRIKRDGWRGNFDWIGAPSMLAGEKVELSDRYYPERAGRYHIDAVTKTWGAAGFRQNVKLGLKLD